ncbi:initiator tRNA phosphoribosyl transferase family protein [Aspergillus saccharolyticus JOP 1030-1]|uniref:tRNA a64-2'-o-ribosylphosphate transferase n=1 Tax=Aspergillus saccharolyticus JOP 1030-1 TaxID=1450539 RepID=A0A318Z0M5_9EURO|nr:tRNA a64-2'-o-ribosylphosphate transferase [Aspergillus saccharolyticus JOP 1030-1]PYH40825.1 tRNA a64-2'-o-ribosylphosphate transferase [Aspergillus saccharolyticus JOP 1030-1]
MDPAYPTSLAALHFPSSEQQSISQTLSALRRSALSIPNRLTSIVTDAAFVAEVAAHYRLPLIANERCGSWYIPPDQKTGSVYFKSTDGHTGVWDFSFRRLNLQVLSVAREFGGCIIVDSTRRGKLMPDALSKTIPIWAAVLNRALFPNEPAYHAVQFPPNFLPASEESQIERRIDGFVKSLEDLNLNLPTLTTQLSRPIRLAWANRAYFHPTTLLTNPAEYNLLVLCSASQRIHGAEVSAGGYIQGAGDDAESWALGLTPPLFWEHRAAILATEEEKLPGLIAQLVTQSQGQSGTASGKDGHPGKAVLIAPTRNLYLGVAGDFPPSDDGGEEGFDVVVDCNAAPSLPAFRLHLGCGPLKLGSRDLRKNLPRVRDFIRPCLAADPPAKVLVVCESGRDLSVGALLAILCLFYDDDGDIGKQLIRQRLAWITLCKPDANPSRSTLQSVNAFLMERPDY